MPVTYDYVTADAGMEVVGFVLLIFLGVYLLILGFTVAAYILQSLGMYTIAKRRQIPNPWLAWIPVGNMWMMGSISDQYQYVAKGRVRNRRKALLGLNIAIFALEIPLGILGSLAQMLAVFNEGETLILWLIPVAAAMAVVTIFAVVIQYMALYDLFASCDPDNAAVYLVLSILFGVTLPFFVFFCRKKDLGMPPRKTEIPEINP